MLKNSSSTVFLFVNIVLSVLISFSRKVDKFSILEFFVICPSVARNTFSCPIVLRMYIWAFVFFCLYNWFRFESVDPTSPRTFNTLSYSIRNSVSSSFIFKKKTPWFIIFLSLVCLQYLCWVGLLCFWMLLSHM